MRRSDVAAVAAIEQASPSPWSEALIAAELGRPQGVQLVAVCGAAVAGWCCAMTGQDAELLKIAVSPLMRQRGAATALLLHLEGLSRDQGAEAVFLEVRAANMAAIRLYQKLGYLTVGCRRQYYSNPQDDALILKKSLV